MKLLERTTILPKIIGLLLLLGTVTMFVAWFGSSRLMASDAAYGVLADSKAAATLAQGRSYQRMTAMLYNTYRTLVYDGASAEARAAAKQVEEDYRGGSMRLKEAETSLPGDPVTKRLQRDLDALHAITGRASELGLANRNDEAQRVLADGDAIEQRLSPYMRDLLSERAAGNARISNELSATALSTRTTLWMLAIGSIVAASALALFVVRAGITGPLSRLQAQMGEIAGGDYAKDVAGTDRGDEVGAMAKAVRVFRENGIAKEAADKAKARADAEQKVVVDTVSSHLAHLSDGDLTASIKTEFPGDYAILKTNFNDALDKLRDLIAAVGESANSIRTGSGEIAQASEDLARRTESNAASLEETAASITQMDGRLKTSAGAASRTVERADQAIATVGGGRAVADEAVQAMGRVSDSAKGIDSVIEGLDKIAFQTRVLAMNAAVEAGRAGDAGRGFAVVADLVSALAMRAEEEAKRARDQLTVTQTDIVTAVEAVQKVDGALAAISGDVTQVHELLATMAADNQAQSAAITQISAAVGTMDQSTQQNAAMVEETSAAARNLVSEVTSLSDQASRFNTGTQAGATRPPAKTAKAASFAKASGYSSPIKPLPAAAVAALTPASADDWKDF
ncbi:methyl-accepting chemotaxis protein [Sphingomonas sp. Tas61C01]|uniref:methyl-accepting chemotaxis protein n=1 Tax=Sphingomonas sp. Tas61C01 TaxID=3458297 RepID=UPI00403EF6C4